MINLAPNSRPSIIRVIIKIIQTANQIATLATKRISKPIQTREIVGSTPDRYKKSHQKKPIAEVIFVGADITTMVDVIMVDTTEAVVMVAAVVVVDFEVVVNTAVVADIKVAT